MADDRDMDIKEIYIPPVNAGASKSSFMGELNDNSDSDPVRVITACVRHATIHTCFGGPTKWDADAKHVHYQEKYSWMAFKDALSEL